MSSLIGLEAVTGIALKFAIEGKLTSAEEIETGHINSTWKVGFETEDGEVRRFILQRINASVFKDPMGVMRNVERVTRHINERVMRKKEDVSGQTLALYPGRDGRFWVPDEADGIWRCYNFIEGCRTYDVVENEGQAYQAARAFGAFQDLVSDLSPELLVETIPGFHDTRSRYEHLMAVVEENACGRVAEVGEELAFIREREGEVDRVLNLLGRGDIPLRITHNDTKINNVMIDEASDEAVCVIDLDTVMPGSVLYDFGDLVRTAVSPAEEDETELSKIVVRMPIFEALVDGYLSSAGGFLNDSEVTNLAFSAKLITLEVAMRFLTDHLEGDRYFKIHHAGHNLERCRAQLRLVAELEGKMGEMEACVLDRVKTLSCGARDSDG
ncbi:phosphotransferase enzyme family protein [Haloferula chungangensis]|uniref:Phosphotransferase enzyme family protein n=1 Tax=Haloferula chungangensis TaxID=1048331 RepID=A0ABW2L283_9BACT